MTLACDSWTTRKHIDARGRLAWISLSALLVLGPGCASIGPRKLVPTHAGYNDAVQLAVTRDVLLNIVRERYYDPSQFLSVSSINAQFSVRTEVTGGATGLGGSPAGQLGGTVAYSDSPTITFVPQAGAGIYKSLAAPVGFEEAIDFIYSWGRVRSHEVALLIGAINYAGERDGPTGDPYRERLAALVRLFDAGATFRHFREFRAGHFVSLPKERVTGKDLAEASKAGQHFYERSDGTLGLGVMRLAVGLVVPLPHEGQTKADLKLLGLTPGKSMYAVRPPSLARPEPLGIQPDTLWLSTRSAGNILEIATLTVDVPPEHERDAIAPPVDALLNTGVRLPMRIRHAARQPTSAYRVQHRGYWFYIDSADLESRWLFNAIVKAYLSRIGSVRPGEASPQIVLPIGSN